MRRFNWFVLVACFWASLPALSVDIEVSPFISPSRKYLEFQIQNFSGEDLVCEYIRVNVAYVTRADNQAIGVKVASARNVFVKSGGLEFKQEAGKDQVAALEAIYADPIISEIKGEVTYQCDPLGKKIFAGNHGDYIESIAVSDDGSYLMTGSGDKGQLGIWDARAGKLIQLVDSRINPPFSSALEHAFFLPGTNRVVAGAGHALWVWDVASATNVWKRDFGSGNIQSGTGLKDGKRFLMTLPDLQNVVLFNAQDGAELQRFQSDKYVRRLHLVQGESRVIVISTSEHCRLYSMADGSLVRDLRPSATAIFVGVDAGETHALFMEPGLVSLTFVEIGTGNVAKTVPVKVPANQRVWDWDFHMHGSTLAFRYASAGRAYFGVVKTETGDFVGSSVYADDNQALWATTRNTSAYSVDGKWAYAGMNDGSVRQVRLPR